MINLITTNSGTYTLEEYKKKVDIVCDAFIKYWHGKISVQELEKAKKDSGLSYCEIANIQYDASFIDRKNKRGE